jgi:hypothetical protein
VIAAMQGPTVEGAYLSGYGVVFTVALPTTDRNPLPGSGTPKNAPAMTEWEREQRRLRGEPLPERTGVATSEPSVGDVLLKLLAENGKHFTSLKDDERVTIAVTFRGGAHMPPPVVTKTGPNLTGGSATIGGANLSGTLTAPEPQTVRDLELLGALHLKQGQPGSAIEAYRKAVALAEKESSDNPSQANTDRLRDVLIRLAQAYLAAGREQDGRKTMESAVSYTGKIPPVVPPANKPTATVCSKRLMISASKKLLDQVGNGKISLDEFRKQALVEYSSAGKPSGE